MSKLRSIMLAAAVAVFSLPPAAHAVVMVPEEIFTFTGTCGVDCTGTATGILTLTTAYTQGTTLSETDFVSFDYTTNANTFDYSWNPSTVVTGIIPVDLPADATMTIQGAVGDSFSFASDASTGGWCVGYGLTLCTPETNADAGLNGSFSATPLPATLPLFAGGLGFVGYLAKRRKQNAKQALAAA
jgi:hypothetical protein